MSPTEPEPDIIGTARADRDRPRRRWPRYAELGGLVALAAALIAALAVVWLPTLGQHGAAPRPSASPAPPAPGATSPLAWAAALKIATFPVAQLSDGPSSQEVFALGYAGNRTWQLAVRGSVRPGPGCVAEVTLRGAQPFPLTPHPGSRTPIGDLAFVALTDEPGIGVGFIRLSVPSGSVSAEPRPVGLFIGVPVITVPACGRQYYLAGFAYPLKGTLDLWAALGGTHAAEYVVPASLSRPAVPGVWRTTG